MIQYTYSNHFNLFLKSVQFSGIVYSHCEEDTFDKVAET